MAWASGDVALAIHSLKFAISELQESSLPSSDLHSILGEALLLMAKWLWKSKMDTPQNITSQYLEYSVREYQSASVDKSVSAKGIDIFISFEKARMFILS